MIFRKHILTKFAISNLLGFSFKISETNIIILGKDPSNISSYLSHLISCQACRPVGTTGGAASVQRGQQFHWHGLPAQLGSSTAHGSGCRNWAKTFNIRNSISQSSISPSAAFHNSRFTNTIKWAFGIPDGNGTNANISTYANANANAVVPSSISAKLHEWGIGTCKAVSDVTNDPNQNSRVNKSSIILAYCRD
jgi:hypothetical protein